MISIFWHGVFCKYSVRTRNCSHTPVHTHDPCTHKCAHAQVHSHTCATAHLCTRTPAHTHTCAHVHPCAHAHLCTRTPLCTRTAPCTRTAAFTSTPPCTLAPRAHSHQPAVSLLRAAPSPRPRVSGGFPGRAIPPVPPAPSHLVRPRLAPALPRRPLPA